MAEWKVQGRIWIDVDPNDGFPCALYENEPIDKTFREKDGVFVVEYVPAAALDAAIAERDETITLASERIEFYIEGLRASDRRADSAEASLDEALEALRAINDDALCSEPIENIGSPTIECLIRRSAFKRARAILAKHRAKRAAASASAQDGEGEDGQTL